MNWLRSRIAQHPRQATILGKVLFLAGSILVIAAVFARAGFAAAFAQFPAWLVPQTPVGYSIAALLVLAGMALIVAAEKAGKR